MSRRTAVGRATARRRVVILGGAGAMGRITARDLVRTGRGAIEVVVADREVGAVRIPGVATVAVDVCDPASLARALDGAFATIASLPYRLNLPAMQGALAAGAHYVDLGGLFHVTRQQLELNDAFAARGVMAILGVGSAPGILNVLAVRAASGMDTVREVHCLVGAVDRTRFRAAPLLGFGYSVDTLLDEYVMPSAVFRGGAFTMVPALDPGERVPVRFPAPVGRLHVDSTLHSEVATLPLSFADRGIREVTFRQGFEPEFMERLRFLVQLGLADPGTLALANGNGISPRAVLLALLGRQPKAKPIGKPSRYEVLRTVVRGRRRGRMLTVTADCHAGPKAGFGVGPDIDTGAPPSIAVQLMAGGEIAIRPGVWPVEQVVPPAPFVRELKRRGMRVTFRTRPGRAPL
jgi:saccharopine dehydrogenase-like NADP-dependent oxidoreductase